MSATATESAVGATSTPPAGQSASTATGTTATPPPASATPATNAVQSPWYSDALKSDGTFNNTSWDRLPDDLKHMKPMLERQGGFENLLRKVDNQERLMGKKALAPLAPNSPPEVVAERNALLRQINGVPEKPEDYGIKRPDSIPENAWNNDLAAASAAVMHKHNMAPAAVKELVDLQIAEASKQLAAQQAYETQFFADQDKQIREQLQRDNLPYDKAAQLAERGANMFGIDPADPVMKNAKVFLAMSRAALAVGEDKVVTGDSSKGAVSNPMEQAQDIIHNKSNPEYAIYWDSQHPQNRSVKAKVSSLMQGAAVRAQTAQGHR